MAKGVYATPRRHRVPRAAYGKTMTSYPQKELSAERAEVPEARPVPEHCDTIAGLVRLEFAVPGPGFAVIEVVQEVLSKKL